MTFCNYTFQTSEEDVIVAQKAIELWNKDGRQILAPSSYNHGVSDKQKSQMSINENNTNLGYKDQLKDLQTLHQINMVMLTSADKPINTH